MLNLYVFSMAELGTAKMEHIDNLGNLMRIYKKVIFDKDNR